MPKVLIFSSSPLDQDRLRLGAEFRDIRKALQRSKNRENWQIESNEATTVDDLRRALLDHKPAVVHFSGHGGGADGLCFENEDGTTHSADAISLARLLHHFKDDLKCVVLNACYSEVQAEVIRGEIDYVVGMRSAVDDVSAAKFAVAFYDALFAGTSFRTAFDLGCTSIDLNGLSDSDVPVFLSGQHLNRTSLAYRNEVPEVERILYSYFNTPFSERHVFTTRGANIRKVLSDYYGDNTFRGIDKVQVVSMKQLTESQWWVVLDVSYGDESQESIFYLEIRNRSIKIEWEATVGLWSMPVKTYLALGSEKLVVARVEAELSDYYNYDFSGQKEFYQSIFLRTKSGEMLHGYIRKGTPAYDDLIGVLSDGNSHRITLEISDVTSQTSTPIINRLLSRTWLYEKG